MRRYSSCYVNGNGGAKPGVLSSETRLSTEAIEALKQGYQNVMSNQDFDAPKALVLNNGVKYTPMTSSSTEMQLNENKKTNSIEISKIFGYPHTIIDGGASEEDKKQFTAAVISLLNYIETELDKRLLLESEKEQGYYWAFDTKEMTRGSQLERYQAYDIALKNHFLQVDEVREAEDYDAMGFNWLTMGLGDILLNPDTMEVFTPNTGQTSNLGDLSTEQRGNDKHDPKSGRFAPKNSSGSVDNSGKSDIIKTDERFELNPDKINKYLLLPGTKHSKEFFDVGYKVGDYELLYDDIAGGFDLKKAVEFRQNPNGNEGFSIFMKLGVTKKREFRTTWERKNADSKPKFTSAYRNRVKKG